MDKDEMIEEMAMEICDKDKRCEDCISRLLLPCVYKSYCTKLYNAHYRKVGEDEIVVKKRQYEQLKKYNRDRKRLRLKWQQAKQDLDDIYNNGFVLLAKHHEIVDQVARETKQETAREIIDKIENLADIEIKKGGNCEKYFDMVLDLLDKELE